jgi:elongator complex protein 1
MMVADWLIAIALLHRRRTSRSKRKLERKAGRKGTVDEEEYLLHSINKVVDKFNIALGMDDVINKRP